jgi:3-oxoacyl-[acyl-carrier protein] reductase
VQQTSGLLAGKTALVTGAAQGIGRAVVERLLSDGACVAAVDIKAIEPFTGPTSNWTCDLSEIDALGDLVENVQETVGPIDVLVNNVAIIREDALFDLTYAAYRKVVAVNLDSPIFLTLAVAPEMVRRGYGRIVNVTSIHGDHGFERTLSYGVAKAGLNNVTKSLAVALGGSGVLVNAVAPGFLSVPMRLENEDETETIDEELQRFEQEYVETGRLPMRRAARAAEIAAQIAWLGSDQNSYVTGHILVVDGGLTVTF